MPKKQEDTVNYKGKVMKQRKLAPILAVVMSLEMILTPVAFAVPKQETSASDVLGGVLGIAGSIYEQIRAQNIPPSPHVAGDMAALQQQQTPLPDKYFNAQKLSQIPGLGQYLAINGINPQALSCVTLPTNLYEAHNEICRVGVTGDKGHPGAQVQEAAAYMTQYTAIDKMYRNFSTESNVGGELFGVGCMKNAMQILNGFFKYRTDELDKLVTQMEAIQNGFKESSKADLEGIEDSTALLNGGNSELANKVKTRRPDLFDFGKRFNNPACASMFSKEEFNKMGKSGDGGGLSGINQRLQDTVSQKVGEFSGESYSKSHTDVVADINSLADKVGKQMELNFGSLSESNKGYSDVLKGLGGLSSANKINNALTPDLFSDMQTKFIEQNDKLKSTLSDVGSELGAGGGNAMSLVRGTNSGAFESEVSSIETGIKNQCLRGQAQVDTVVKKIYDPSASKFANENASNFLKDKLKQIMEDDKTSLDKKLSELQSLEKQQGSRYFVKMENSYEVQDVDKSGKLTTKVVEASTARTPSVFFSDIIKNCEAQFKTNTLRNKLTGAAAIQKLRQVHQDYKNLAKSHAQEVKQELKKKLISCDSPAKANASVGGSCTPNAFDPAKAGFCANGALSCSKNMQACSAQAEKFVTDIKQERTARVGNYKKMVEKNKNDIVKLFDSALSRYMKDGEMLRGQFGAGFSSPAGIQREVPEGQRHLSLFQQATQGSPDGSLLLEDPDKYVAMFKANISLLKTSVKEQQEQILGGGVGANSGILAKHVEDTGKKYAKIAGEASKIAKECQGKHDQYITEMEGQRKQMAAEQGKKQTELGEKSREFCRKYGQAQEHPGPACAGSVKDLTSAVAAIPPDGHAAASEFEAVCDSFNNESKSGGIQAQALELCNDVTPAPAHKSKQTHKGKTNKQSFEIADKKATQAGKVAEATNKKYKQDNEAIEAYTKGKVPKDYEDKQEYQKLVEARNASREADKVANDRHKELVEASGKLSDASIENPDGVHYADEEEREKAEKAEDAEEDAKYKAAQKDKEKGEHTTGLSSHEKDCRELLRCLENHATVEDNKGVKTTHVSCNDKVTNNIANKIVKAKGHTITVEGMPAFCAAGNNGGGPPKNFFESMQQGVQKGFAGGAVGH